MSGERDGIQGGDNLRQHQHGDNNSQEQHDPFGDVRAGGVDRIAKAGDNANDSSLEKEAANPIEGFQASQERWKTLMADPIAREMAKSGLDDISDMYVKSAQKEFGEGAAAFVKDINQRMLNGQTVDLAAETNIAK